MIINNASGRAINLQNGTTPDVSGALFDWFQPMTFTVISKTIVAFQVIETPTDYTFQGVIQPFKPRDLLLLPIGQRAWSWFNLFTQYALTIQVDDVVTWNNKQTRVMSREDYFLEGIIRYTLIQDWSGALPTP